MNKIYILILSSGFLWANLLDFKTIAQANRAYEKGEFTKSATLFGSLEKESSVVAYNRANALYKARKYDEALEQYAKAKGVDEAQRLHNMGNSYFKKQAWDKAIEHYEKALNVKEDSDTRFNLELAKREKREEEKRKEQEKKKEKKKKPKNDKKDKKEEKKKPNNPKKQEDKSEKDKKEDEKKKEDKKKSDKPKKKQDKQEKEEEMTPEEAKKEALRKRELKHMMKQLAKKKMPTMMYQTNPKEQGEKNVKNPW